MAVTPLLFVVRLHFKQRHPLLQQTGRVHSSAGCSSEDEGRQHCFSPGTARVLKLAGKPPPYHAKPCLCTVLSVYQSSSSLSTRAWALYLGREESAAPPPPRPRRARRPPWMMSPASTSSPARVVWGSCPRLLNCYEGWRAGRTTPCSVTSHSPVLQRRAAHT